ncbi:MAG: porphobilinogen synthase [Gracilibacteraceae bacterium]|jgi:porphobilinogen synthase|nr:porphobilinogen synthase [Gracilibacteraceae bacterium]
MIRTRRLRRSEALRDLVRETELDARDFIYPLFITARAGAREEIISMPGIYRYGADRLEEELDELTALGLRAVLLFGLPAAKDELGSGAWAEDGVVQQAVRRIKALRPEMLVITDVCLCEYTSHGHCGLTRGAEILNDETLPLLARTALSHAAAGADVVAPSDMMDGRVAAIRTALDGDGFADTALMAYSVKYASAYYGPFREAADGAPQFGDRRTYQMDPGNAREALRKIAVDTAEGADMLIVKPALAYLDIVRAAREYTVLPLAAYNVSGEYAMLKAAGRLGWLDAERVMLENLLAMKRAGADMVITYHAKEAARLLREGR